MDPVVRDAEAAIERRDWEILAPLLHPYVHGTLADGRRVRGRHQVLAALRDSPARGAPARYELRDGQIYRWDERQP